MRSTTHSHVKNKHWKELEKRWEWGHGISHQILKVTDHFDKKQGPLNQLSCLLPICSGKKNLVNIKRIREQI